MIAGIQLKIEGIRLKICGQTRVEDAHAAAGIGADFLGFILHPKSPRYLPLERYRELADRLPVGPRRVAVMVEPTDAELAAAKAAGFDHFQIHFDPKSVPLATVSAWSRAVGPERLWLAPKLPPGADVPGELLPAADTFLLDTFKSEGFGGTGRTGDWAGFARHQAARPGKKWILAGGLAPENIAAALTQSGATFVDVNSGVEATPGVKDHAKLKLLAEAIRRARTGH